MVCWDIEKVFDQNKNKLGEKKAWAKSPTAKKQQAQFLCLAHNLMLLLLLGLKTDEGITDEKSRHRRLERKKHAAEQAERNDRKINSLVSQLNRATQCCLQFIRWLRISMIKKTPYTQAVRELRPLMLHYIK